jgi:two-component system chemotaxis response regulator CheY
MKYLVVDDSATMRRIVVNSLQRIGVTDIVEAGDGREALEKFDSANGAIGFLITDWNMPNMGGIDLAKAIRTRPGGKALPILMVTARSVREDIITALESEVNYYIVKPFTPAVLKEKIDALLSPAPVAVAVG